MLTASDECYYYLRNQNNHPVATVCLLRYGTDVARGISICAKIDQFDKYIGKGIAYSRAIKGIKILKQADKPLTERQIRLGQKKDNLGKKNRRYVEFEMVQRKEAIGVVKTQVGYQVGCYNRSVEDNTCWWENKGETCSHYDMRAKMISQRNEVLNELATVIAIFKHNQRIEKNGSIDFLKYP
jgi:hypothetical protein